MKEICWLLIITLLLGCLAGCGDKEAHPSGNENNTLLQGLKDEIKEVYEASGTSWDTWWDEGNKFGSRYYGTYNGYIILFHKDVAADPEDIRIADYTFTYAIPFNLFAYKDRQFHSLKDIYQQGLVSEEAIKSIWEAHCRYQEAQYANDAPIENEDGTLSEEMKKEMDFHYSQGYAISLGKWWDEGNKYGPRYYGTHDGYVVYFTQGGPDALWTITIADYTFEYANYFMLRAYKDGKFYSLEELYAQRIVDADAIKSIWDTHCRHQEELREWKIQKDFKSAFLRQYVTEDGYTEDNLIVEYYGSYDGIPVAFIHGIFGYPTVIEEETIAGLTFRYSSEQRLLVCKHGDLLELKEAFEKGWLSEDALKQLLDYYKTVKPYLYEG